MTGHERMSSCEYYHVRAYCILVSHDYIDYNMYIIVYLRIRKLPFLLLTIAHTLEIMCIYICRSDFVLLSNNDLNLPHCSRYLMAPSSGDDRIY